MYRKERLKQGGRAYPWKDWWWWWWGRSTATLTEAWETWPRPWAWRHSALLATLVTG